MGGESGSLILLPNSTESDSSNAKARRVLVIVTGSSLSWLWGCFVGVFFRVCSKCAQLPNVFNSSTRRDGRGG